MEIYPEHELEAAPGLPEPLPAGERVLWQGSPNWKQLALEAFHVKQVAIYFVFMLLLQAVLIWDSADSLRDNLMPLVWSSSMAIIALGMLAATAWMSAQTTLYTLTNRRIVMRIGIVLTISFNLPLRWIAAAHVKTNPDGSGDIALELKGSDRIAYLHLWPHARPWELSKAQPSLRCLKDVGTAGDLLHTAWIARQSELGGADTREAIPVRMPAAAIAR